MFVSGFFFFKQKTAYELRISDWSSDVCSSDLNDHYVLDIDRARQLLGWEPKHRLRNALPKMVAALKRDPQGWYKANKLNPALVAWYGQRPVTPARAKHDGGADPGMDHMAMGHKIGSASCRERVCQYV